MKKLFPLLLERPAVFYLILFHLMIFPAIILFFAAQAGSAAFMALLLGLVILANMAVILK